MQTHTPSASAALSAASCGGRTKVVFVSTYPPRRCGIATFTRDLREAMENVSDDLELSVCAVDRAGLSYGPETEFVLRQDVRDDYAEAARALAAAGTGIVVIEHEYGIFGGPDGEWITLFAEELDALGVPFLVTLHTILSVPSPGQAAVLERLCRHAFAVSVFTDTARRLAIRTGVAPAARIVVVPHGAPAILYRASADAHRDRGLGSHSDPAHRADTSPDIRPEIAGILAEAGGGRLLSTFGLVSAHKGLEMAIEAVAHVAAEHPDVRYVIAGRTHPEIVRVEGEAYRDRLTALVAEFGLEPHVTFIDHYLSDAEIALLLHRTDIFLTPYRSAEQISSGALTFALAAGCAAVSTSYHYARDMLAGGAGVIVEPGDLAGFSAALRDYLDAPERLSAARGAAARLGGRLSWPVVAGRFTGILRSVLRQSAAAPRPQPASQSPDADGAQRGHGLPRRRNTTVV